MQAAHVARVGLPAYVGAPKDAPETYKQQAHLYGADLRLLRILIVQAEGNSPLVQAFHSRMDEAETLLSLRAVVFRIWEITPYRSRMCHRICCTNMLSLNYIGKCLNGYALSR